MTQKTEPAPALTWPVGRQNIPASLTVYGAARLLPGCPVPMHNTRGMVISVSGSDVYHLLKAAAAAGWRPRGALPLVVDGGTGITVEEAQRFPASDMSDYIRQRVRIDAEDAKALVAALAQATSMETFVLNPMLVSEFTRHAGDGNGVDLV